MIILTERKLKEQLIVATSAEFEKLKSKAIEDIRLRRQLTLPLGNLPQYQYLFTASQKNIVGGMTLLSVLKIIFDEGKAKIFFSKAGDNFTGFITYMDSGSRITGVKMASFFDDNKKASLVIVRDLKEFIAREMRTHQTIEWEADVDNDINTTYQETIPKWFPNFGFWHGLDDKRVNWLYKIYRK